MKHKLVRLLCIILLVAGLWVATVPFTSAIGNDLDTVSHASARRSLLSAPSKHETALLAALDGTVHFVDHRSSKVLWSFKSGPSIYSSYQASVDDDNNDKENTSQLGSFFIDCGDDWALYMHYALRKEKLQENFEDFISKSPVIVEDGGTLLGSKKSTVFLVDAKTGRLIYTYGLSDSPSASQSNDEESVLDGTSLGELRRSGSSNLKPDDQRLYITRTDYLLEAFAPNNKVLWNLTVADIGAAFLYPEIEKRGALSDPRYVPSKAVVYRVRNPSTLGPYKLNMLPEVHDQDMFLAQSNSNYMLLWQTEADKLSELHHKDEILSLPDPNPFLSSESNIKEIPKSHQKGEIDQVQDVKMHLYDGLHIYVTLPFISFVFILVGFVAYYCLLAARKDVNSNKQPTDLNTRTMPSKRKKIRKSGKSNGLNEESDEKASSGEGHVDRPWLKLNQPMDDSKNGRTIGKLHVSNSEIAKGSNGTIVLEGIYEGRPVAVKRLVKAHHDVAYKEIQNLIASDRHPNIVRWYGVESDQDFVYLALERCACSFSDLIQMNLDISEKLTFTVEQSIEVMTEDKVRMDVKGILQDVRLWKENGYPSPVLLKLMRDVVSGLMHLHELGIIHRDLKPQNVLIIKERSLCAKLSDMGISKRLVEDRSSLGHYATGYGSSGWQAPEQLLHGRQTRAVDMFSLGCVLFYCITGGKHPFGEPLERDINIVKNKIDLFLVDHIPEAVDLFSRLLDPDADLRPTASEVFHHPLFWNSEDRLSFFRDTSDRVELENRETKSDLLSALENIAPVALGTKWDEKMEPAFLNNIGRYRRYKFDSVRDLLRVMRNKLNHYRELPVEIQEILGSVPEGFDGYFASRFPKLLIEVYKVMHKYCKEEEFFSKYFKGNII